MVDLTVTRTNCLVKVREGAAGVALRAAHVTIDAAALEAFAAEIPTADVARRYLEDVQPFPLRFASVDEEVNFHSVLHLLNFGSAYQDLIADRTVAETVQYGMLGLVLSGRKLSAQTLSSLNLGEVGRTFGLEVTREARIAPDTPIYTEEATEVAAFARLLLAACETTGRRLRELDCEDFAQFYRKFLDATAPRAAACVYALATHLPPFCDGYTHGGGTVLVLRKAQLLAMDLARRFGDRVPLFRFEDIDQLCTPIGDVEPAVLRTAGVLRCDAVLEGRLVGRRSVTGDLEAELRCAALTACHQIAARAGVTGAALHGYLASLAAEGAPHHDAPRPRTPLTLAF